jgi:hypothetical protein
MGRACCVVVRVTGMNLDSVKSAPYNRRRRVKQSTVSRRQVCFKILRHVDSFSVLIHIKSWPSTWTVGKLSN